VGRLLLMITIGVIIVAFAWPGLALVALAVLGLFVMMIVAVLVYGMYKLRHLRRQMRQLSQTFSQRAADPPDGAPPRPRQRVQCKVRDEDDERRPDAE